jgi:hypothetical protein
VTVLGLATAAPDPPTDALLEAIAQSSEELGMTTHRIHHAVDEASVDMTLYLGLPRWYGGLLSAPRRSRRILWFGEVLPRANGTDTQGMHLAKGSVAVGARVARPILGPMTRRTLPGRLAEWRAEVATTNARLVNLEDARRAARLVDRIVVTSRDRGRVLGEHGLDVRVVPFGYHPAEAGPLIAPSAGERDIAVAVVGRSLQRRSGRRAKILARLVPAIERLGPVVLLDGVWGRERDTVLQRTRIVVDVQNAAGNFGGLRFLTTLAAGAVLVTDTIDDPYPFRPGIDHVEAPVDGIVAAIADLLDDEPRRLALAEAGQARLRGELAMRCSLERVLEA